MAWMTSRRPGRRRSPPERGGGIRSSRDRWRAADPSQTLGVCDFPHRLTDPRFTAEPRSSAGRPHNSWSPSTIFQERKNIGKRGQTRPDNPQPRRERSRCLGARSRCRSEAPIAGEPTGASAGWRRFPSLFGRSKRGRPRPEPEGRVYGMSFQSDWGRPTVGRYGERYFFRPA